MPDVHLDHILFTRVEKAYSLKNVSGYQVVYKSQALGFEVDEIERVVQCFLTNKQQLQRYQFFWTSRGQAVCTKSVNLIAPDREVIDRDQRDAFLTHALVLSREDFARVRNDPFAVFEAAESQRLLTESVPQLAGYLRTTRLPDQLHVHIRTRAAYPFDSLAKENLLRLYRLAEAAPALREQKRSILMIDSNPAHVFFLLSLLLFLLPLDERAACTFDTFVDNCTPSAGSFWTIGSTRALNNSSFVPMRLAERQIASVASGGTSSAYSGWFSYALQHASNLAQFNEDLYSAQLVAEAFKAHVALPVPLPSERVLSTFHNLNAQVIDASLAKILAATMGKPLSEAIMPTLYAHLPLATILSMAFQGSYDGQILAPLVYAWFIQTHPTWKEWEDVLKFAGRASSAHLFLLASLKMSARPFKNYEKLQFQSVQDLLDAGKLSQTLTDLIGSMKLDPVTQQPYWDSILSEEEFQVLVHALLQRKAGYLLSEQACVRRVPFLLKRKIVQDLAKAATNQEGAPEFVQTLQQRLNALK